MKIYDCFSYWDEDLLLDLRLNILDSYVDYFVIVEGNKTWQNNPKKLHQDYEYILATSKLLPNYGFPAGLDVIDKAARIHSWLGKAAKGYYQKYYLNLALNSKDPTTIISALKSISDGGRKFKNRPKAGRLSINAK